MFVLFKENISVKDRDAFLKKADDINVIIQEGEEENSRACMIVNEINDTTLLELSQMPGVQKIAQNLSKEEIPFYGRPFFPHHLIKEFMVAMLVFALLIFLACFYSASLHQPADPDNPPPGHIKPEWYFCAVYQTLKYVPTQALPLIGVSPVFIFQALAGLIILAWPFIERTKTRKTFRYIQYMGIVAAILFIVFTLLGIYTPVEILGLKFD
ncbi:MAG: hypothetical protein HZA48_07430 [Planctomycetes bacterium]|nr:hypothetical protein [Planctomycetota bacterium]